MNRARGALCLLVLLLGPAGAQAAQFQIVYGDLPGEGFFDPSLGAARRGSLQRAADVWGSCLLNDTTIRLEASFNPLGGSSLSATLGYGGPTWYFSNLSGLPAQNTWYVSSLADAMTGQDLKPSDPDIMVVFNSDVDGVALGSTDWYYGPDDLAGRSVDFQTVAMHEIAHGLGFLSSFNSNGTYGYSGRPTIFDTFLTNAAGQRLVDLPASASNVISPTYFSGPQAEAAWRLAGGEGDVKLFSPATWRGGSSLSHLDEATFRGLAGLMSPYYDQPIRFIDSVVLGVLADLGWRIAAPTAIPEPGTAVLLLAGLIVLRRRRGRANASRPRLDLGRTPPVPQR